LRRQALFDDQRHITLVIPWIENAPHNRPHPSILGVIAISSGRYSGIKNKVAGGRQEAD
jgi:hypothetical protein